MGKLRKKPPNPPRRVKNSKYRAREYLTATEIDKLLKAAKQIGRHRDRDAAMILMAYRHGLRISELIALKWSQIDLKQGLFHVVRRKNGVASTHPLFGPELRALRALKRNNNNDYIFITERKAPITGSTFRKLLARAGKEAKINMAIHPHMLRHSTGFKLANDGQDTRSIQHYLGHRNIQHTVRYTEISPKRFKGFWKD